MGAIGLYFYLKEKRPGKASTNLLIVLLIWAIAVPIFGFILTVLSKVWGFVEAVVPTIAKAFGSFYSIYDRHPILVLVLIVIGFIAYFVWKRWWPKVLPNRGLRLIALTIAVIVAAHIANPIANLFIPAEPPSDKKASPKPAGAQPSTSGSSSVVQPVSVPTNQPTTPPTAPALTPPQSTPAATAPPASAPPASGSSKSP